MNSSTLIQFHEVCKTYETGNEKLEILKNISLSIDEGQSVAITGESGSGKSTLLNLLGGLDTITSGRIQVGNVSISHDSEQALTLYRRKMLGLVFQFHYLLKDFTALENVMIPLDLLGIPRKQALSRAGEMLERVGLKDRMTHFPSRLSGGERQRVAIARALVHNPSIVLADEPTGNLDIRNSGVVQDLLLSLVETMQVTLVLVTHDMEFARRCSSAYFLRQGEMEIL